jgi:hypothetical protein
LTIQAIDWTSLSLRGAATLRLIAMPISQGFLPREVAVELGTTASWVLKRLDELEAELRQGLALPPL